jgi:integrase
MQLCWYRGHWYAREGRKRYSLRTKDRDEALRRLKDVERERIAIGRGQAGTVADILDAYVEERKDRASIAKIKDAVKALKPIVGHLRPDQVDRSVCRDFRKRRKASDGTKRKELGVLQAALRVAGHQVKLELPPMPPPRDVFITKAEFERLVANAEAVHIKTFLYLAWFTAARKEALLSLTWDAVHFEHGRINTVDLSGQ